MACARHGCGCSQPKSKFTPNTSSLGKGARRAWGLACALFIILLCVPAPAGGVAPNTPISNTAQASFGIGGMPAAVISNTVTLLTVRHNTPSQIELLQYAPQFPGAPLMNVPPAAFDPDGIAGGATQQISAIYPAGSTTAIDLSQPVPLVQASAYHQGEPLFIQVIDPDQNTDSATQQILWVLVSSASQGDSELLLLTESGPDSGLFVGYLQSSGLGPVQSYNGVLDVAADGQITVQYTDQQDTTDTAMASAAVDPFGLVFDSATGQPVDNVQLTLIADGTSLPAVVWGDDGVSPFPATIASGGTFVDGSGKVYAFTPGHYRFPFVAPGTYRLLISPPAGFSAPSAVPTAVLQTLPGGPFVIAAPGSRGEAFVLNPGPAVRMDIPVDPSATGLWLRKSVNQDTAAIGDFVQYTVGVENNSGSMAAGVSVADRLPAGFRYVHGSVRLDGHALGDPQISADGRSLTFGLGDLADGGSAELRYVAAIGAGTKRGKAINRAQAAAGVLNSNTATAAVTVKEDLFRSENVIVGRVIADNCADQPTAADDGVAGVRIYLEDGTYTVTDKQGMYHFEGISSGSHVVQVDTQTLPAVYEMSLCAQDSRSAGTPFARFVDLHGGALWRTDFHVQTKTPPSGEAVLKLACELKTRQVYYEADIDVRGVDLQNLSLSVILPPGNAYIEGSSRLNGQPADDPQAAGQVLIYRWAQARAGKNLHLRFGVTLADDIETGQLHTKALLTFDSPGGRNQRTDLIDTVLALTRREVRQVQAPVVVHPRFDSLSEQLTARDRLMLDRLCAELKGLEIEHAVIKGHSDNRPVRPDSTHLFADNQALSLARARTVAKYLAARLNLTPAQMTVVGMGARQPVADNSTEQGRARNRRVEVTLMTVKVDLVHDISSIKCEDQVSSQTRGGLEKGVAVPEQGPLERAPVLTFDQIDMEALAPGLAWVLPGDDFLPNIPSVKLAVAHAPDCKVEMLLNGQPLDAVTFAGVRLNGAGTVAVSQWGGVGLSEGDNQFTATCRDAQGREVQRIQKNIRYAGVPVSAVLDKALSRLVANGQEPPVIAVRLTDKHGIPARFGVVGEYSVQPPHRPYRPGQAVDTDNPLTRLQDEKLRYTVGAGGIARIRLQATTQSGYAVVRIPLNNMEHEVRAWLAPESREWILVGLAEGTAGYNTVSGNMETLDTADGQEDFYRDGRLAFFAKGRIKGSWLLTMAYDSARESKNGQNRLFQTIDPDTYYTLYGDATEQQYEASSIRTLFLKIEREQFYALFGDYDTGLTMTELSRYSRRFNGIKSEYAGDRFGFSAFATDTDQAFVKDEIRGDGTSGLYRLSRTSIRPNSEKVTIETRDRFHSEVIVSSQTLTRHIDYSIDYDAGTLFFKMPVYSRDENFNPTYIVVEYESGDASEEAYTYGGRGSAKLAGGKVEVGTTLIQEGSPNAEGRLAGVDAKIDLGRGVQIKAEAATTRRAEGDDTVSGQGYLAELSKQSGDLDARLYFREQGQGFGLGQQNGSEAETRKVGAEAAWRWKENWSLSGELYRQSNLATDARRDLGEARVEFNRPVYSLFSGVRLAEDRLGDGQTDTSTQLLLGGARRFMDNRLQARFTHEQSIGGNNASADFPTRTILGADYKIAEPVTLFAEHEITQGESEDTQSSRIGVKATPWTGGQIGSSLGRQCGENGQRVFANLGLTQTWRISERWSVDGGLDRTTTVRHDEAPPFNSDVPTAAGAEEDFTALSLGAGYKADLWSWNARLEGRTSESQDKTSLITGIAGEVRKGLGLSAGLQVFNTETSGGAETLEGDVRFSLAYRPKNTRWIVLDRLEYEFEEQKDADGRLQARRIVNNLNANFKAHERLQLSLQYGAKYVFDTIDGASYTGYTDLTGLEARYDLTAKWDLGLHTSVLHAWNAGQIDYRTGLSVGYAVVQNMWVSLGCNFTGFEDQDFSAADYTAAGPYIKFRIKFDQQSVRDMVNWFAK